VARENRLLAEFDWDLPAQASSGDLTGEMLIFLTSAQPVSRALTQPVSGPATTAEMRSAVLRIDLGDPDGISVADDIARERADPESY